MSNLSQYRFNIYYLSAVMSSTLSNALYYTALVWVLFTVTQSITSVTMLLGIGFLARAFGAAIHKYIKVTDKCKFIVILEFLRVLIFIIISIFMISKDVFYLILIFEFINSVISTNSIIESACLIKSFVNSKSVPILFRNKEIGGQIFIFLGSSASGFILAYFSIHVVLFICIVSTLISIFFYIKIKALTAQINQKTIKENFEDNGLSESMVKIMLLFIVLLIISIPALVFDTILVDYVSSHLLSNSTLYGVLDGIYAIGAVFAMFGINYFVMFANKKNVIIILTTALSFAYFSFGFIYMEFTAIIMSFFVGYIGVALKLLIEIIVQIKVSKQNFSITISYLHFFMNVVAVLTLVSITILSEFYSVGFIFILTGLVTLALIIALSFFLMKYIEYI